MAFCYCGFCGFELYQMCFCRRAQFQDQMRQATDPTAALNIRHSYYQNILKTITPEEHWLIREPGNSLYRGTYLHWLKTNNLSYIG